MAAKSRLDCQAWNLHKPLVSMWIQKAKRDGGRCAETVWQKAGWQLHALHPLEHLELRVDMDRERHLLRTGRTGHSRFCAPPIAKIHLLQAVAADMPTLPRSPAVVEGSSRTD